MLGLCFSVGTGVIYVEFPIGVVIRVERDLRILSGNVAPDFWPPGPHDRFS